MSKDFAQQPPGAPQDHRHDRQPDHGIDPAPACEQHQRPGDDHAQRDRGIGNHVQPGAARIQVVTAPAHEQQGRAEIDQKSDPGHDHDGDRGDLGRLDQAADGLDGDGPAREDQQDAVAQRRQHRRLAVAVGAPPRRRAPGQPGGAAGQTQAQHIGQVVAGICHQGRRLRDQAIAELDDDEDQISDQPDPIAPVVGRRGVVMTLAMAVIMVMRVVVIVVIVGHGSV